MRLFDDMNTGAVASFAFSGVRPETLGATEYTLVSLVIDKTGSVSPFSSELLNVTRSVVEACKKNPRADYLLFRLVEFNAQVDEVHGFVPLSQLDVASYVEPACGGMTSLRDAAYSSIGASNAYAKTLADQDYQSNAIVIIVTDGEDNSSTMTNAEVRAEIRRGLLDESLESLRTILVGVNAGACRSSLQAFQKEAGIDEFVDVADASPSKLARLADFISRSISLQSQALGTGGPSRSLTF